MSKVQCSYVPKVIRTGVIELSGGARFFIVEQYIEGETYRDVLIRNPVQSLQSVLALCEAMLSACCDFEAVRIVHRDLKPENLMVDTHGKLWIIDFGIARHLDLLSITPDGGGFGVGTLGYAAPEQFHNIKAEIDARTDLYAAGIIIYEGLTGSHPYMGRIMDHRAILRRMETTDLPRLDIPGDVNGEFARFISALGQRFPSRRPQSAGEAHAWFKQIPLVQGR